MSGLETVLEAARAHALEIVGRSHTDEVIYRSEEILAACDAVEDRYGSIDRVISPISPSTPPTRRDWRQPVPIYVQRMNRLGTLC